MRRKFQNHNLKSDENMARALAFIDAYTKENGFSPSVREIGKELNVPSTSTVAAAVDHMIESGYINEPTRFTENGRRIGRTFGITKSGRKLIKSNK